MKKIYCLRSGDSPQPAAGWFIDSFFPRSVFSGPRTLTSKKPGPSEKKKGSRAFFASGGFTLLELLLVIVIMSIAVAIAFPRFSHLSQSYLRTDAARVATLIRYLSEAAATKKIYYRVWFDFGKDALRVEHSKNGVDYVEEGEAALRGLKMSSGVAMEDMVIPGLGKVNSGEVSLVLAPAGSAESFTLHLRASEKAVTLSFNPFSGAVKVTEGYS